MDYWEQKIASMYLTASSKNKIFLLFLVIECFSCHIKKEHLPYYNTPDFTPIFLQTPENVSDSIPHRIDNFSFTNQDRKTVTQKDVEGKIHIANFIFTSCISICPVITNNLKKAGDHFEKDSNVVFLSYTVTPWIDNPTQLNAYKAVNEITNDYWHFLTGNQAEIYNLARTSYFAEEDLGFTKDSTDFLHTEHILLIDKTKRIRGIYNGTLKLDIEQLISDINQLKSE